MDACERSQKSLSMILCCQHECARDFFQVRRCIQPGANLACRKIDEEKRPFDPFPVFRAICAEGYARFRVGHQAVGKKDGILSRSNFAAAAWVWRSPIPFQETEVAHRSVVNSFQLSSRSKGVANEGFIIFAGGGGNDCVRKAMLQQIPSRCKGLRAALLRIGMLDEARDGKNREARPGFSTY